MKSSIVSLLFAKENSSVVCVSLFFSCTLERRGSAWSALLLEFCDTEWIKGREQEHKTLTRGVESGEMEGSREELWFTKEMDEREMGHLKDTSRKCWCGLGIPVHGCDGYSPFVLAESFFTLLCSVLHPWRPGTACPGSLAGVGSDSVSGRH